MKLFVSKIKVAKAILLGTTLTIASFYVSAKTFYILFPTERSVFDSPFKLEIITLILCLVGVFGFLMFGAMTIVFISRLFYVGPQVIINLEGIEDKRLNTSLIRWNEISAVLFEKAEQWRETITNEWKNKLEKSDGWYKQQAESALWDNYVSLPWQAFPKNDAVYEWDEKQIDKWLLEVWLPFWNGLSAEKRDEYLEYKARANEGWREFLEGYEVKEIEKLTGKQNK